MRTVDEYIKWKNGKERSLEERFVIETKKLEWDETDVLYSFLGVYAIGLKALYPKEFVSTPYQIRKIVNNKSINVYSKKFLFENWENYQDLNNILETTGFLKNYLSIGNLIPIWPGGNTHKG